MKAKVLIDKAVDIAKNYKTLYVMGCFGAPLTGGNVSRYCSNHAYNQQAARIAMIKAAANQDPPVFGFDCVNLIKGILWGWNGDASKTYGGAKYAVNGVPDTSADGMIKLCTGVTSTGWDKILPGEAVWLSGHIGIYIGDGLAVECTPAFANKVQITAVKNIGTKAGYSARKWTKHGRLPWVEYSEGGSTATTAPAAGTTPAQPPASQTAATVAVGDAVKIKSGATYYNGKAIPKWVQAKEWIVSSVSGDRAVINKSVDGANAINSPINTAFLTVTKAAGGYTVKITASTLNVRKGPGTNYPVAATVKNGETHTIAQESSGQGATLWGKLKDGAGWISLDYAQKV